MNFTIQLTRLTFTLALACLATAVLDGKPSKPGGGGGTATHTITPLGTLGGDYSFAYGLNESGQTVGLAGTISADGHAFLWQNGLMTDLGTLGGTRIDPGAIESWAEDINDAGQVVGSALTAAGEWRAFLLTPQDRNGDGKLDLWFQDLDGDGANDLMHDLGPGSALAVNNQGQVLGENGWVWDGTRRVVLHELAPLRADGLIWAVPYVGDINDAGRVVATAVLWDPIQEAVIGPIHTVLFDVFTSEFIDLGLTGDGDRGDALTGAGAIAGSYFTGRYDAKGYAISDAYLFTPGAPNGTSGLFTGLGSLGDSGSYAAGVNAAGQIVGASFSLRKGWRSFAGFVPPEATAFLWQNGTMKSLYKLLANPTGWSQIDRATDINDSGWITGHGFYDNRTTAFLVRPLSSGN